ncbi:oligoendopeptidase F [Halalkaliarchaeum desulfuricum]|uniref:Oligoendopeptidase F n=1 Tax=Halalkaliarchaeum desulfuricum TaxID=2055893 RepID=A0A343THR0_9EURY|nr:oligoendopeptidase F [Halalkaliarchaeum desulfuricum]AUX08632.1 oligoendopeptidase F [Halalkaliarchaeum desulfuricum]
MSSLPEREEIEREYKWALESIYEDDDAWENAYESVSDRIDELAAYEGELTDDPETLLEFLERREELMRTVSTVVTYANLRKSEDTRNQEYQALSAKASTLQSDAAAATSYVEPELQTMDDADVEAFMEQEPELREYEHFFDDVLRMKPHTRSPEIEELLAELGEVTSAPSEIYSMLSDADMTFPTVEDPDGEEVEISQANFVRLQKNPHRPFRRTVHEEFYDEWETVRNAVGTALEKQLKKDVKVARARNYDTAREAALDGSNVPTDVYDALVDSVRENLDALHRHSELKRRALEVDELRSWDLYMSLTGEEGPDVEYEQAEDWIVEAVEPLGEPYQRRLQEGLDSRWVDVYENRGKRSGAFSSGTYDTQPFILMNYQDDVPSMFTLAHELGHSMHSELAKESQPWQYAGYDIFVAEIASTVNETLLTDYLLENAPSDEIRIHVLDQYLERFRSTLFRQTMFADFEHRIHTAVEDGKPLTPDAFDQLYGELKAEFYDPAELDDRIHREWMRIPHFYYNFYVFQYATGISAAAAVVERIRTEGEPASESYREMLRKGGSEYPLSVVETAGIDMTSPAPVESAIGVYRKYLDRAEDLLET